MINSFSAVFVFVLFITGCDRPATPAAKDAESLTIPVSALCLPSLSRFDGAGAQLLADKLAASPDWRVCRDRADLVAVKRASRDDRWMATSNGFIKSDAENVQSRQMFRFAESPGNRLLMGPLFESRFNVLEAPGELAKLKARKSHDGIESYLAIGRPGLWFQVFEQSEKTTRTMTQLAIDEAEQLL